MLYHLRHPLLGLDRISAVCDGQIYVESFICDDYSAIRGGLGRVSGPALVAEFYPTDELPAIDQLVGTERSTAWRRWIFAAGFTENLAAWKLTQNPNDIGLCRGFATGSKPAET